MKEFMLLILNEFDHQKDWSDERQKDFIKACEVYINDLKSKGKLKIAQPLIREGKIIYRSNGEWKEKPFNERKEVQVGYYHIFAKDINEAIEIAKRNPEFEFGKTARIEVRPIKVKEEVTGFVYPENQNQDSQD